MDRKEFFRTSLRLGTCCAAVSALERVTRVMADPSTCEPTMGFARAWVADFMSQMDARLDQETKRRVMERNGRACFTAGNGAITPPDPPPDLDTWLAGFQKHVGRENLWRDGDRVHFKYVSNPRGLRVADGYCLCPLVEDGPATLSVTFCHCSVGYVSLLFEGGTGRKAQVTLLDSLRRGGKECHFLVRLAEGAA
jgi:hypothetical protein